MEKVYLSLGSNLGDRAANIAEAVDKLDSRIGLHVAMSSVIETESWGFSGANFLNCAVLYETDVDPLSLLGICKEIERGMGRRETVEFSDDGARIYHDRTIDIDILMYGKEVIDSDMLQIPHPRMAERAFAMYPFMDIAPDLVHPVYGESISDMVRKRFGGKMPDGIVRIGRMP